MAMEIPLSLQHLVPHLRMTRSTVTRCDSKLMPQENSTSSSAVLHGNQDKQSNTLHESMNTASLSALDGATASDNVTITSGKDTSASDRPTFLEQ